MEVLRREKDRCGVVVGVHSDGGLGEEVFVEGDDDMGIGVVEDAQGADGALMDTEAL